jgi:eukaryotic-like serine/threonine-protein kinase
MPLDAERWHAIQELFHRALEQPAQERTAFLERATAGDGDLLAAVLRLLDADARTDGLLDRDVGEIAGEVLDGSVPRFRTVGPYRVVRVLGQGGMGVVYLAERDDIGARVAVKVLRDASLSPGRRERFQAEQRTLAALGHPSIARLYHADVLDDGTPYFVMEYVEGLPLGEYCRSGGLGLRGRIELLRDVCEAVDFAHRRAVIHRDLKPSNILVGRDGSPRLLDFGIAKQLETVEGPPAVTRTGLRLMTPAYAAPEQVVGDPVGVYTDVYALGVILYELLTGELPYDLSDRTPGQAERIILERDPLPPSARVRANGGPHAGGTPERIGSSTWRELDLICATAMDKDPQRRYRSAGALLRDLDHFLCGEPLAARPAGGLYRMRKFVRRNRRSLAIAAGVAGVLAASAAYYTVRLAEARDLAVAEAERTRRIQAFVLSLLAGRDEVAGPADSLRVLTVIERGAREARALDADPLQQADLYLTLGGLYQQLGRFSEADSLLDLALRRRVEAHGPGHAEVLQVRVAQAVVALDRAEYGEAVEILETSLEAQQTTLPQGHPDLARTRLALGRALDALDRHDTAIGELERAVSAFQDRPDLEAELSSALAALASAHLNAGRLEVADSLNRRTLAIDEHLWGARHPTVANALVNLGVIEFRRGRYEQAEPHYREAVAIFEGHYGPEHPQTASALRLLGQDLVYQGRLDDAREPLERALAIQEASLGPMHPRLANTLGDLAYIAADDGDFDTAVERYLRITDIYRTALGERHLFVAIAVSNLASAYMDFEHYGRAEPLFRDAVQRFTEARSADDLDTGIARIKLGRVLARQGRTGEAERELLAGYEIVSARSEPTVSWLRGARTELAAVYDALGRPDEAQRYRAEQARVEAAASAAADESSNR